jgi:hypothetical protein
MYRYTLEKSSKKKSVCPKCDKRTLVRFIDNETGNYLSENYGRCDREIQCGYFLKPSQEKSYFSIVKIPEVIPINYFDYELMVSTKIKYNQNNFVKFLFKHFELKQVNEVIDKYNVGTTKYWYGATIFWQVDNYQRVRFGKVMIYNPETCKRIKNQEGGGKISSVRAILNLKDFNHKQCLFGLHLINSNLSKPIAIVESEKTAIIMSIEAPNYIWLATGSKSNLKEELLKPLKNRIVVLYPDNDSFNDWQKLVSQLKLKGYKIAISDLLEKMSLKVGSDLADYFIENNNKIP